MANFLTYRESYCHHDLLRLDTSPDALLKMMLATYWADMSLSLVGDSDSALLVLAKQIVDLKPSAPWLFIYRPVEECRESYQRYFTSHPYPGVPILTSAQAVRVFDRMRDAYLKAFSAVSKDRRMMIHFNELDNADILRRACLHLGVPFNLERSEMLSTFSVNIISEKVKVMDNPIEAWRKQMAADQTTS